MRTSHPKKELSSVTNDTSILAEGVKNFILGAGRLRLRASKVLENWRLERMYSSAKVILGAKEWVNSKYDEGHIICFFTARPERQRRSTETWLRKNGIRYHSLVMDKPNAVRYHYIDDHRVQATTFMGKFTPLITKEEQIRSFRLESFFARLV